MVVDGVQKQDRVLIYRLLIVFLCTTAKIVKSINIVILVRMIPIASGVKQPDHARANNGEHAIWLLIHAQLIVNSSRVVPIVIMLLVVDGVTKIHSVLMY